MRIERSEVNDQWPAVQLHGFIRATMTSLEARELLAGIQAVPIVVVQQFVSGLREALKLQEQK